MKRLYLLAMLAVAPWLTAQSEPCPVTITEVRNAGGRITVLFRNTGEVPVTAYRFGLIFVDGAGGQHPFPEMAAGSKRVVAGTAHAAVLTTSDSLRYLFPKANAYLVEATFANGTRWSDDGSHACGTTSWQE